MSAKNEIILYQPDEQISLEVRMDAFVRTSLPPVEGIIILIDNYIDKIILLRLAERPRFEKNIYICNVLEGVADIVLQPSKANKKMNWICWCLTNPSHFGGFSS